MKKKFITILIFLIAVFIAYQYKLNLKEKVFEALPKTIKIGAILDLTGVSADIGIAIEEGIQIAADEINARGGVQGKNLQVIYEDAPDQAAKGTINAGHKLIENDRVKAILDMPYSGLGSLQTLAEQYQIPIVDSIDSSDQIASYGDWIFSTGIFSTGVGQQVAQFAKDELNISKATLLVGKDEYLLSVSKGFEDEFKNLGGQITMREEFLVGEKDFRSQLIKIKNSGAEAIFAAHLGEGGIIVKQARELGFEGSFLGSDTFSLADVKRAAGNLLNDKTFFALWRNFDALNENQKNFGDRYEKRFKKEAGDYLFYNVLGYDSMMVLAEAMKNSDLAGIGIKNALYQIQNFNGLSGSISIDSTGINRGSKNAMVMYKNGKIIQFNK